MKFRGVIFDENLNWNEHLSTIKATVQLIYLFIYLFIFLLFFFQLIYFIPRYTHFKYLVIVNFIFLCKLYVINI